MRKLTDTEKRDIALQVNAKTSKSGKTLYSQYIYDEDEIVRQFREYVRRVIEASFTENTSVAKHTQPVVAEHEAHLAAELIADHMPALVFFFRRYLTQR